MTTIPTMSDDQIRHEAYADLAAAKAMWDGLSPSHPGSSTVAPYPGGEKMGDVFEPARRQHCPEVPRNVVCASVYREWSKRPREDAWRDVTHGASFFEVGARQEPLGDHGDVIDPATGAVLTGSAACGGGDARCTHKLPGLNWGRRPLGKAILALGYTVPQVAAVKAWLDPRAQVLAFAKYDTAQGHGAVRAAFPDLFPAVSLGTTWDLLAMAFEFSRGEGAAEHIDAAARARLAGLSDAGTGPGSKWAAFSAECLANFPQYARGILHVNRKWALAMALGTI